MEALGVTTLLGHMWLSHSGLQAGQGQVRVTQRACWGLNFPCVVSGGQGSAGEHCPPGANPPGGTVRGEAGAH